jgi:3-hydroxyisobutyrate dehydrogenase-like beta-hydroxyacid dehydrogenase
MDNESDPANNGTDGNKPAMGILHPGEMGLSVAATAQNTGHTVYWVSEGRSANTVARAARRGSLTRSG